MTDSSSVLLRILILSIVVAAAAPASAKDDAAAADAAKKITFEDDVLPIFRNRCGSCHNAADRAGGLQLDDYAALMQGGGSGDVVYAADPDSSYLWMVVNHDEEPVMPPNSPKMPAGELALIRGWIDQGLLLDSGSKAKKAKANPALAKVEVSFDRPDGPVAPTRYLGDPELVPSRPGSVTALAVSPWASVAAVSGHRQVTLWDLGSITPLGTLAYPEGQPHAVRFSRNGKVLLVAGGRGGMRGEAALFDVVTGERIATVGNEYDQILAADVSPDLSRVAVGGPKKMLRVHDTATNEVVWEADKHTDWITAARFSPDGVLLASADRSGGVVVWEADTGREFYVLNQHKAGVTAVAWRADGNVLATATTGAEDTVRLFDMNTGNEVKKFNAGVDDILALDYSRDGRLLVTGRNRQVKAFDAAGKQLAQFDPLPDLGMEVAWDNEGDRVLVGDWTGQVRVHDFKTKALLGVIRTNAPGRDHFVKMLAGWADQATQEVARLKAAIAKVDAPIIARRKAADEAKAKRVAAEQAAQQAATKAAQAVAAVKAAQAKVDPLTKQVAAAKTALEAQQKAAADAATSLQNATAAVAAAEESAKRAAAAHQSAQKTAAAEGLAAEAKTAAEAAVTQAAAAKAKAEATVKNAASARDTAAALKTQLDQAVADAGAAKESAKAALVAQQKQVTAADAAHQAAAKAVEAAKAAVAPLLAAEQAAAKAAPATDDEKKQAAALRTQLKAAEEKLARMKARMQQTEQTFASAK